MERNCRTWHRAHSPSKNLRENTFAASPQITETDTAGTLGEQTLIVFSLGLLSYILVEFLEKCGKQIMVTRSLLTSSFFRSLSLLFQSFYLFFIICSVSVYVSATLRKRVYINFAYVFPAEKDKFVS